MSENRQPRGPKGPGGPHGGPRGGYGKPKELRRTALRTVKYIANRPVLLLAALVSVVVSALLGEFLSGGFGRVTGLTAENTDFLSDRAMSEEETVQYLSENCFPDEALVWQDGEDGVPVLRLNTVTDGELTISDVPLTGRTQATYRFTDLYGQHYWTPVIPEQ